MNGHIVTVVGNRPQFIKMAPVSAAIAELGVRETVIHSGQHYDDALNAVFFRELDMPAPQIQLTTTARSHGAMTGELLTKLEAVFLEIKPKHVLLYGDTNTTLAAALAAAKLHIGIAHVEAGPRNFDRMKPADRRIPEEVNRVTVDHLSDLLFCADKASVDNLAREGITQGVYQTGDVMLDAFQRFAPRAAQRSDLLSRHNLKAGEFFFMTLHRPANVDNEASLRKLLALLARIPGKVLFPAHLRTLNRLEHFGLRAAFEALPHVVLCEPIGYIDSVQGLQQCRMVLTDSGGVQKEAYYAGKRAISFFNRTLWPDLEQSGWQYVAGTLDRVDNERLLTELSCREMPVKTPAFFGDGKAAEKIAAILKKEGFFG